MRIKNFHIERTRRYHKVIVPIGCDCHPAHVLEQLCLRRFSLPFDWMGSKPETTLKYVMDCINTKFEKTFSDLYFSKERRVVSQNYPHTRFSHVPSLAFDEDVVNKYVLRGKLLCDLVEKESISYLCNIKLSSFGEKEMADGLIRDIAAFASFIKPNDTLHIYFSTEYDRDENREIEEYLFYHSKRVDKVWAAPYFKDRATYGIWGNHRYYPALLNSLGIKASKSYRIRFVKSAPHKELISPNDQRFLNKYRQIALLKPEARPVFESFISSLEKNGLRYVVLETIRTKEVQRAYYAQGRKSLKEINRLRKKADLPLLDAEEAKQTVTKTKYSKHQDGVAADIVPVLESGEIPWSVTEENAQLWRSFGRLGIEAGLEWGGTWAPLNEFGIGWDAAHYQLREE